MSRMTALLVVGLVLVSIQSRGDGLTALQLQSLLASASAPDGTPTKSLASGVDLSFGNVTLPGSGTARLLTSKLADHVSVADFAYATSTHRIGGASSGLLATAAASGDSSLVLAGSPSIVAGELVAGPGITPGTRSTSAAVPSSSGGTNTTTVALSAPVSMGASVGASYDFGLQDDLPAFVAAENSGAHLIEVPAGATGSYFLAGSVPALPGVYWSLQGARISQLGGITDAYNQVNVETPSLLNLLDTMRWPSNESTISVSCINTPTKSSSSYQKNCIQISAHQGDPSDYSYYGLPDTAVRDLVGQSIQMDAQAGNTTASIFGGQTSILFGPSTDGTTTGLETVIYTDSSLPANHELNSLDNKTGWTTSATGGVIAAGGYIRGNFWTGLIYDSALPNKAWAVRTTGPRNSVGLVTTHSDYAYADHLGNLFGQSLHIAGSPTSTDIDPIGGVLIDNQLGGRIAIGNSTLPTGNQPALEFHLGSAASSDTFTTRLVQTTTGLQLQQSDGSAGVTFHVDHSTEFNGFVVSTHAPSLVSGGSNQTSAVPLSARINTITSCASGAGVLLPSSMPVGGDLYILNRCGTTFTVYGLSGVLIEAVQGTTGISSISGSTEHFYLETLTQWRQLQ